MFFSPEILFQRLVIVKRSSGNFIAKGVFFLCSCNSPFYKINVLLSVLPPRRGNTLLSLPAFLLQLYPGRGHGV